MSSCFNGEVGMVSWPMLVSLALELHCCEVFTSVVAGEYS